jgi:hypothetical protein
MLEEEREPCCSRHPKATSPAHRQSECQIDEHEDSDLLYTATRLVSCGAIL